MKRYDLSKIMRTAHNLYKHARVKYPAFSDALKRSWKMAKFNFSIAEQTKVLEEENKAIEAKRIADLEIDQISSIIFVADLKAQSIKETAKAKAQLKKEEIAARKSGISYSEYQNRISTAMGYGCGCYCAD